MTNNKLANMRAALTQNPEAAEKLHPEVRKAFGIPDVPKVRHALMFNPYSEGAQVRIPLCMPTVSKDRPLMASHSVREVNCPECAIVLPQLDACESYEQAKEWIKGRGLYKRYQTEPQHAEFYQLKPDLTEEEFLASIICGTEAAFWVNMVNMGFVEVEQPAIKIVPINIPNQI